MEHLVIEYKEAWDVVHAMEGVIQSHEEGKAVVIIVEMARVKQCDHIRHSTWSESCF